MWGSLNNRTLANTPNTEKNKHFIIIVSSSGGRKCRRSTASEWQDHLTGQSYITSRIPAARESVCVLSQSLATPWTVACQVLLPMGFSRQECWSELPLLSPRDLPDPGIEPVSLASPSLAGRFFTTSTTWEPCKGVLEV